MSVPWPSTNNIQKPALLKHFECILYSRRFRCPLSTDPLLSLVRCWFSRGMGGWEGRWVHAASGRSYNIFSNPPKVAGKDDVSVFVLQLRWSSFDVRVAFFLLG